MWHGIRRLIRSIPVADPLAPKPLAEILGKIDATPDNPTNFGYKMSWLAIKSSDAERALGSLDIQNLQRANWHSGLVAAYNGHAFVSPAVHGWGFVASYNLPKPDWENGTDAWSKLLSGLSKEFGDVQYFVTHRVVEYHAWARFIDGKEIRAFAFLGERGETMADRGSKTVEELELGYGYLSPASENTMSDSYWARDDVNWPDEDHVMEVAGKWSISPNSLEELRIPPGVGWIGNLRDGA